MHSCFAPVALPVWILVVACSSLLSAQTRWEEVDSPGDHQSQHTGFLTTIDGKFLTTIEGYNYQGPLFHAYESTDGAKWSLTSPTPGTFFDVKDQLQLQADRFGPRIRVDDGLAMMTVPGLQALDVTFRWRYGRHRALEQEGRLLDLSGLYYELDGSDTSPTIEIISASYGAAEQSPFTTIHDMATFMGKRAVLGRNGSYEDPSIAYQENNTWKFRGLPSSHSSHEEGPRHLAAGPARCLAATEEGLFISSDLATWAEVALPFSELVIRDLRYANGQFVAVGSMEDQDYGYYDGPGFVMASADGSHWTFAFFPDGTVLNAVNHGGGQWACGGDDGILYTSPDGFQWSPAPSLDDDIVSLAHGNDHWVAGTDNQHVLSSPNLQSWTLQSETAGPHVVAGATHFMALNLSGTLHISPFLPAGTADIIDHPGDALILPGQTATFTVAAIGDGTLSYQWFQGASGDTSQPVSTASGPTFESPPLSFSRTYWVRVRNHSGEDFSTSATATVARHPEITEQPVGILTDMGKSRSLDVDATGGGLHYQWFEGFPGDTSQPVSGATSDRYSPPRAIPGTTHYWVRVSNIAGSLDSNAATATILPVLPTITRWDTMVTTPVWTYKSLSVSTSGPYVSRQFYRGESGDTTQPIPGATSSYYTPDYNTVGEFRLWVRVSNPAGHVDSDTVVYSVTPVIPRITSISSDETILEGHSVYLSVSSSPYNDKIYQWYEGQSGDTSNPVPDETLSSFYESYDQAGLFRRWVRVTNPHGSTDSQTIEIRVVAASYTDWAESQGLPTDATGLGSILASAAGDGVPNIIRFSQGRGVDESVEWNSSGMTYTDPGSGESYLAMWITLSKLAEDITPGLQESSDGETWTSTGIDTGVAIDHGDGTVSRLFRCSLPLSAGGIRLIRAAISHTP